MAPATRAVVRKLAGERHTTTAHLLNPGLPTINRRNPNPHRAKNSKEEEEDFGPKHVWDEELDKWVEIDFEALLEAEEEKKRVWRAGERKKRMRRERTGGLGAERRRRAFNIGGGKGKGKLVERLRDERGRWMRRERV